MDIGVDQSLKVIAHCMPLRWNKIQHQTDTANINNSGTLPTKFSGLAPEVPSSGPTEAV